MVVTFEPDIARLRVVLESVATQVDSIVVVDNGSSNRDQVAALLAAVSGASFEQLAANLGIGAALNAGADWHVARGQDWLLTLDQDTALHAGAVSEVLRELDLMPDWLRRSTAVVGMSRGLAPPQGRRRRWVERSLVVAEHGLFTERLNVITSGNLVRAEVFGSVRYEEKFFMDHVDTRFCADVRRAGRRVLEYRRATMDHRLGATVQLRRGPRVYERGDRIYYITRNGFALVARGDLPLRVFLRDVVGLSSVYVECNGARSFRACLRLVARGILDGATKRFGPRPSLSRSASRGRQ